MGALLPDVDEVAGTPLDSRFEVGDLLARGGFANVMEGYDREQKQRCAIKVFRGEVKDKAWMQRRFDQEVAALRKVHHPNVVSIYAHGTAPSGAPYLVMEFVEGRDLRTVLELGALPPRRTARLLRQLAGALDAIHAQGIWHRDVKPENIIVRNEGTPGEEAVLLDFSIAIVKDSNETLHGLSRAAGSFDYMAPEQAIGYAEPCSDIYSLAKLAVEMLAGRRLSHLLPDASLDLPDRLRELLVNMDVKLSPEAIEMLASALEFDPAKRPRVAGSFVAPIVTALDPDDSVGEGWMAVALFRMKHPFQPAHPFCPTAAYLLQGESRFFRNLFQREPAEVVHVDDTGRVRVLRLQPFHQKADFNNLLSLLERRSDQRPGHVKGDRRFSASAANRQPLSSHIHENAPHCQARQRIEMSLVLDLPPAPGQVADPEFVDQLRPGNRRHAPLPFQFAERYAAEPRQDFPQQGVCRSPVALHKELQPARKGGVSAHRLVSYQYRSW